MNGYLPEGRLLDTAANRAWLRSAESRDTGGQGVVVRLRP